MSICYLAYPTSLSLRSANALQTYLTMRALRARCPTMLALIARWEGGPSRFTEVGAIHLPRPAIGRCSRLVRSSLWYYLEYSAFAWMCLPYVAAHQIQVLYVRQNICAAWWSSVLGPRLGIAVIYEAHDLECRNPSRAKEPWAQGLVHLIDRLALTRSTAVVSLTNEFRRYLVQIGWRSADDIYVIPDGYDETTFFPQERGTCRRMIGIPDDAQVVAYAGMTFAHRWLEGLLAAVAQLLPTYPRILLLLVGGREAEREALRQQAIALGLAERLLLVGPQPQERVVRYLGAADVLVIPDTLTDITASPLKLFEYLALGTPMVLPDLPALQEIVPPDAAHYFPRRHLDGLVHALTEALCECDNTLIERRQAIASCHTYGHRADRILAVVQAVGG